MNKLTQDEFRATKNYIREHKPKLAGARFYKRASQIMGRSIATIHRIDASQNYKQYKELIEAEHTPKNPRVPLSIQLQQARVEELLAVKAKGRFAMAKYVNDRLKELLN